MAPPALPTHQAYAKDERVLCFHHELLYEAKILDSKLQDPSDKKSSMLYLVHYKGWKNTWDDWVSTDRIRKFTEENKELAQSLKREVDNTRKPAPSKVAGSKKKAAGSDLSSTRGSEERQSSAPATGRGQKRGRDTEIEKVGSAESHSPVSSPLSELASGDVSTPFSGPEINPTPSQESRVSSSPTSQDNTHSSATEDSPVSGRPSKKPKIPSKPKTPSKRKAPRKRKGSSTSSGTTEPEDLATIVDRILAQDPPKEKRVRRLHEATGEYIDWPLLSIDPKRKSVPRPVGPHPQLRKSYRVTPREDPGYVNRFILYRNQNPNHRIMVAGVPPEDPANHFHGGQPSMEEITPTPERDGTLIVDFNYQAINTPEMQEETFHARPHIRIPCPDNLKSLLVDDWENVTKNLQLVPLPSKTPVNTILDNYFEEEKGKRRLGSAEADLLEEVVAGVKEYFDKALGRILLYRFEREQFTEIRSMWEGAVGGQWEGKGAGDVYGAEHLARLFVSMPELIAQTNMDQQAVNRLREELAKITQWLGKKSAKYFTTEYEAASHDYIEKARGAA